MKNTLLYWRNSIADAAHLSPASNTLQDAHDRRFHLSREAFADGSVDKAIASAFFKHWTETNPRKNNGEDAPQIVSVLLCPLVFVQDFSHGAAKKSRKNKILAPLSILAMMSREGRLTIPGDNAKPQINRDFLEPANNNYTIGTVDDADLFYATEPTPSENWQDVSKYIRKLINAVGGKGYDDLAIDYTLRLDHGLILIPKIPKLSQRIIDGYDRLIDNNDKPQLLDLLIESVEENGVLNEQVQLEEYARHFGQMGKDFPLTVSQRETLSHFLHAPGDKPEILAVNGPPGTGKTTLIQNIVATLWVEAALKGEDPPVIVAAAATNKAVTNIIDAFASVKPDALNPLADRWLQNVSSLGMFMPSSSADKGNYQTYSGPDEHFAKSIEIEEGFDENRRIFLERFNAAFPENQTDNLETAKAALHEDLAKACARISEVVELIQDLDQRTEPLQFTSLQEAVDHAETMRQGVSGIAAEAKSAEEKLAVCKSLELSWMQHQNTEPFLITLFSFLPAVKERRVIRDHTFMITVAVKNGEDSANIKMSRPEFDAYITTATKNAVEKANQRKDREKKLRHEYNLYNDILEKVTAWAKNRDLKNPSRQDIWACLDKTDRHNAFLFTMHYWEAAYLLEVEKKLAEKYKDAKSPEKLKRLFRRLAKLAPCFVSTFHMLPEHFTGWRKGDENWDSLQLLEEIDLLITDEAGQATPETSALSFAFAKRALVVGDLQQIQPIKQIPESIDRANMERFFNKSGDEQDDFHKRGLSASRGSLLAMAQAACPYTKFPELDRGMFLREHFRCLDDIISYCNKLCYDGALIPSRGELQSPHPLPAMGFANIDGGDRKSGGSRSNQAEADVIAEWISTRREELETYYNGRNIGELLGVLTPFAAQAQALRSALQKLRLPIAGKGEQGITVGTLHSLQGAERKVILFSPTYGRDHKGSAFFGKSAELLNVAVSRAQDSFLVFGNMRLFDKQAPDRASSLLGRYLFDPENEITDITPVAPTPTKSRSNRLLNTLDKHRQALADAFTMAENRMAIVSPFLSEPALNADNIDEKIRETTKRGVTISIYADRNLMRSQEKLWACLNRLSHAGAEVFLPKDVGVHSKLLWVDTKLFVVGSFNWLSAARAENHPYRRYEVSAVYENEAASLLIEKTAKEISDACEKVG